MFDTLVSETVFAVAVSGMSGLNKSEAICRKHKHLRSSTNTTALT